MPAISLELTDSGVSSWERTFFGDGPLFGSGREGIHQWVPVILVALIVGPFGGLGDEEEEEEVFSVWAKQAIFICQSNR